jgi:hypothetical protein
MDAALGHEPSPEKDAYHHVGPGHYHRDEMPAKHN